MESSDAIVFGRDVQIGRCEEDSNEHLVGEEDGAARGDNFKCNCTWVKIAQDPVKGESTDEDLQGVS